MALKATSVQVSLTDVEPVKTFIADIVEIGTDATTPAPIRARIVKAARKLESGFATVRQVEDDLAEWRGWKIPAAEWTPIVPANLPSVCIVIPVYNSPALLKRCLTSLMRTDYPGKVMYTLVDNASADPETLQILASRDFEPIRFDEPVHFATAVNAGMRQVEADIYVLFNQDCAIDSEDWLTQLVGWMAYRPNCAVAGPKLVYPADKGMKPVTLEHVQAAGQSIQHAGITIPEGTCARHRFLGYPDTAPEVNCIEKVQAVTGAVMAIKRSALEAVGYLDEGYGFGCEDIEFCLRVAAKAGLEVWYVPTSVVIHRDHGVRDTNQKASPRIRKWAEGSDRKFRSEWGSFVDRCATESVAFVLPDFNPVAGGCRVVAALANRFIQAGLETTVYVMNTTQRPDDPDLPRLFPIKPLSEFKGAGTLIATRFDTVNATLDIPAKQKFYLVQAWEGHMAKYCGGTEEDVLESYRHTEYEVVTIGEHLRKQLEHFGRTCKVLDVGLYTHLYPYNPRERMGNEPLRVLMYHSGADYKGALDAPRIAQALRDRFGDGVVVSSFHRDLPPPGWSDHHYQPTRTAEVAEVYSAHDVYVYASRSDGFAMTPVEAMACGLPVILTDFPGKDQYAKDGENCLIADCKSFEDVGPIVEHVDWLSKSPCTIQTLRDHGLATAFYYDWAYVGAQYLRELFGVPV